MADLKMKMLMNGRIYTADKENPYGDAMIIGGGKILWVGEQAERKDADRLERILRTENGERIDLSQAEIIDLKGRRVIPGFADVHMHPVMLADFRKKITVMPPEICSIRDLTEAIRERRSRQEAGQWIEGWGYDEQGLAEKRAPVRQDLDRGCSDSPVMIMRNCAHICSVNTMALKLAGIDRNTPDPPGGQIDRDRDGEPTGILRENARSMITAILPRFSREEQIQNLLELGQVLNSQGITSICDMGNLGPGDNFPLYEAAAARGFCQKTGVYYMWDYFADRPDFTIPEEMLDRRRQIFTAGLKLIGDGSVSGRTAWMDRPYLGSEEEYGLPVCSDELLQSAIAFCRKHRCQLSMHAMGGRAVKRMTDLACEFQPWTPEGIPYVRLEHVTEPMEESIEKAAAHGISCVTQPIFLYAEIKSYLKNLSRERISRCYPVRRLLEKGVRLGFSTDAPATFWSVPTDPFPGLKMAVTRTASDGTDCGREQAVDIETAVWLYTRGSALAAGLPEVGMLSAGYQADFAVLSEDIFAVPAERIDQVKVMQTWIRGRQVYNRDS